MADLIQFVDSISATPTVRLDLNDEAYFWVKRFDAPPPRVRRSMANNAMRDGIHVGSSSYGERVLTIELESIQANQDLAAVQMQRLWRELDRANNWIRYQPNGLTKPVFFRTYRSDTSQLEDVIAQAAMRTFTIEVLAEPFALGLKESLGPYTVNNDPAAASNGCYVDLPTILGDVPTPLVLWDDAASDAGRYLVATHASSAVPLIFSQAESMALGTDTTNPGGGPDALMSGTGTNNYARTSFATDATMQVRLTWTVPATAVGTYRVVAFVRTSAAGLAEYSLGCSLTATPGGVGVAGVEFVPPGVGGTTARAVVDLGLIDFSQGVPPAVGYGAIVNAFATQALYLYASRVSGTPSLDWDAVALLPVGGQSGETFQPQMLLTVNLGANPVVDGVAEVVSARTVAGDPTTGAATFAHSSFGVVGGFPLAQPAVANRLFLVRAAADGTSLKATTTAVTGAYWPRYVHVRPETT